MGREWWISIRHYDGYTDAAHRVEQYKYNLDRSAPRELNPDMIHVREVTADTVTITREELIEVILGVTNSSRELACDYEFGDQNYDYWMRRLAGLAPDVGSHDGK